MTSGSFKRGAPKRTIRIERIQLTGPDGPVEVEGTGMAMEFEYHNKSKWMIHFEVKDEDGRDLES